MTASRLTYALDTGGLVLPDAGRIALFGASAEAPLPPVDPARLHVIQTNAAEHAAFEARGLAVSTTPDGPYAAAIVTLPRARDLAEARIAAAEAATPEGLLVIDGAKTDGVEALLKAARGKVEIAGQVSKAHGKVFWMPAGQAFAAWQSDGPARNADGWLTAPGAFSADGVDPASAALADALPQDLGARVADLGAGWGYLSARVLDGRAKIAHLDLVEIDHDALICARGNLPDPRAQFHWADATTWRASEPVDTVVMNPPFHQGRKADPDLGRAFIDAAARALKPKGALWLVANRHLPYETHLGQRFANVSEVAGTPKFKILHATAPRRAKA